MPNWCEGTLKVRGTVTNIKKFILEGGLLPVDPMGSLLEKIKPNKWGDIEYQGTCWIKNSHRGFVDSPEAYFSDEEESNDSVVVKTFDARFAWGIDASKLLQTCKEFNIDMKIYAFERGQEFNQNIEIVNGEVIKDQEITFDDYMWECICPMLGG